MVPGGCESPVARVGPGCTAAASSWQGAFVYKALWDLLAWPELSRGAGKGPGRSVAGGTTRLSRELTSDARRSQTSGRASIPA